MKKHNTLLILLLILWPALVSIGATTVTTHLAGVFDVSAVDTLSNTMHFRNRNSGETTHLVVSSVRKADGGNPSAPESLATTMAAGNTTPGNGTNIVISSGDALIGSDWSISATGVATCTNVEVLGVSPGDIGGFAAGQSRIRSTNTTVNSNAVITGHNSFSGNTQLWYLGSSSGSNQDVTFLNRQNATLALGTNNVTRLTVGASGDVTMNERVGVGTTPDELLHVAEAVDGVAVGLLVENSQANTAASTNETAEIRFGFGGNNDVARIVADKRNDYTTVADEDSTMQFFVDINGTATQMAEFRFDGLRFNNPTPQIQFNASAGGTGNTGILYQDSGSTLRNALIFPGSDVVRLCNRASNGVVEIRANTSTAGSGGETLVATFTDTAITTTVDVGVGTTNPQAGLHGVVTDGRLLWTDVETDATNKQGRWGVPHFTNAEEPFFGLVYLAGTSTNVVNIGGGSGLGNAATEIGFTTAANNTTTSGTRRMTIDNGGTVTVTGTLGVDGFTALGADAPVIKMKKLTGTAGATEGDTTNIAHGLTLSKVIGLQVLVTADNGNLIPPGLVFASEFEYDTFITPTNAVIRLSATNSGNMTGNAITVLLTYEE